MLDFSEPYRRSMEYCTSNDWQDVVWMVIIVAAIVTMAVLVVRYLNSTHAKAGVDGDIKAIEIARERYAKGEISKEEFTEIKEELAKK